MVQSHLRVYYGPEERTVPSRPARKEVTVSMGEILPVLADAFNHGRTWLSDFADDDITISTDLYEIILAYQHFRRPSA